MIPYRLVSTIAIIITLQSGISTAEGEVRVCGARMCLSDTSANEHLSQKLPITLAAVFSDDPNSIHDPRYSQSQTGDATIFAPIGIISTNSPVPHQANKGVTLNYDMGTAFLVSPCYVLTNYHVVFGNVRKKPDPAADFSMTFHVLGKHARAVPERYGEFYRFEGRDWVLLRLDADADQRCLGENAGIGWINLTSLQTNDAMDKSFSIAGYPSDKTRASLWRQDSCHLFKKQLDIDNDGVWTTDCATRPRSSGSPIFFIDDGKINVVALMQGHLGEARDNEILPRWDMNHTNLAVDIGKIFASDPDIPKLIQSDIARVLQPTSNMPQAEDAFGNK